MNTLATSMDDRINARAALVFAAFALLGCGFLYALSSTALGGWLFPQQARGSLLERDGRVVGSASVAQAFADARYFQPRPSASGFDPMAAAGSNLARSNPALHERINAARVAIATREGIDIKDVPADLATQSGSGLDPQLSPASIDVQIARVARARGMTVEHVRSVVAAHTEAPQWGVLGRPRINVLQLNLALDALPR